MKDTINKLIDLAIEEDIGTGDITTEAIVSAGVNGIGRISAGEDLIVAGLKVAEMVFARIDSSLVWRSVRRDGDAVKSGDQIAEVGGSIASILRGERIALNFLQHLSGIATFANRFVREVSGTGTEILDTRKTTPGYRMLEKEAVRLGGGKNHRMGLFDRYLIKDNHIAAAGSITKAVEGVKRINKAGRLIEVEVKCLEEVEEALASGIDIIMLDNFTPKLAGGAVKRIAGRAKVEISGNINIDNVRKYAKAGADYISIGAITHSAPAADIHMSVPGACG